MLGLIPEDLLLVRQALVGSLLKVVMSLHSLVSNSPELEDFERWVLKIAILNIDVKVLSSQARDALDERSAV
jgi:hypothetical protein